MKAGKYIWLLMLMVPLLAEAQYVADTTSKTVNALANRYWHIKIPHRELDTLCNGIYTTVKVSVRKGQVCDRLAFTGDCPLFIKKAFQDNITIFTQADWKSILPASKDMLDYNVLLPCIINVETKECYGVFSNKEIAAKVKWDIDLQLTDKLPWFLLPSYKLHKYPLRH